MKKKNLFVTFMIVFTVMLSSFAFYTWQILFTPNILIERPDQVFIIPKGATFKDVQQKLYDEYIVNDMVSFSFLAKLKDYDELVKPGLYTLRTDMTNLEAINLLRSGEQTPVLLTYTPVRKLEYLPERISETMGFSEDEFAEVLLHDTTASYYGFDSATFISMFIPNTYEVYWTATPKQVLDRMKREYEKFWTDERKSKAEKLGLSQTEVSTLASIVEAETKKMDEAPTVAGVYINRLKRNYKLQADPTLVYAVGDFSIRRVLNIHKEVDSPYNTYKYSGLPPGPINMPTIAAIDAVLNYKDHNYLYFCAKPDFSGYHAFARTLTEHNKNARAFQRALNQQQIFE
jgi:UPF0755 protein